MNISSSVVTPPVERARVADAVARARARCRRRCDRRRTRRVALARAGRASAPFRQEMPLSRLDEADRRALAARREVAERGGIGDVRVALHLRRIGVAVVVDRAELEPARPPDRDRRARTAVVADQNCVGSLYSVVTEDRRRRLGQAGARVRRRAVAATGVMPGPQTRKRRPRLWVCELTARRCASRCRT